MTHTIRYIMVGGFLGAGKTTTLGRLAKHYQDQGLRVGIVTNDQAANLVDTNSLRSQGFHVNEVAGACFCCRFNDLMSTIDSLGEKQLPDVILAEPVGSCTDLVATVLQPIKQLYDAKFSLAPFPVILKPSHGRKVLRGEKGSGFSPKAEYILRKQLEEADAILINRIDELTPAELKDLIDLVEEQFPSTPVLRVSARTGAGFDALTELLDQRGDFGRKVLDIDYDTDALLRAGSNLLRIAEISRAALAQWHSLWRQCSRHIPCAVAVSQADGTWNVPATFLIADCFSSGSYCDLVPKRRDPDTERGLIEPQIATVSDQLEAAFQLRFPLGDAGHKHGR